MKKIIGIICTILGFLAIALLITIGVENYDNKNISYIPVTYKLKYKENLNIEADICNISFVNKESNEFEVSYYTSKKLKYTFFENDDSVTISSKYSKYWFSKNTLNTNYFDLKITGPLAKLNLNIQTGELSLDGYAIESLNVNATTFDLNIKDSQIKNLNVKCSTGDFNLSNSLVDNIDLDIKTTNIEINDVISNDINLNISTGKIRFVNTKAFDYVITAKTSNINFNGYIDNSFKASSTTGDILLDVNGKKEDYKLSGKTTVGTISFAEQSFGNKSIDLKTTTGNLKINFFE